MRSRFSLGLVASHFFSEVVVTMTSLCYGFSLELGISEDDHSERVSSPWTPRQPPIVDF
ncbi:hypothetical protein A2U01_0069814, partial [Trifolium medium]|nr:hypothetical protein [Trifolium medium]